MDPFIGQIMMFGGNFAPNGWAFCDGQLLPIAQYTALFSLLGTNFGGDGRTTFGLPDLRGRFPMHYGSGPGLTSHTIGEKAGSESHSLAPSHSHVVNVPASTAEGESGVPTGRVLAAGEFPALPYVDGSNTSLAGFATSNTGGGPSVSHLNPYQCVTFVIALVGIYPSRS